jgi:hypothetical protein
MIPNSRFPFSFQGSDVVSALLQTGLASTISGTDMCNYALLQVLRAGSNTCDGDSTVIPDLTLSWTPSPCGSCPGIQAACPSAAVCTQAVPRVVGCDCLVGSDCASGMCDPINNKCAS